MIRTGNGQMSQRWGVSPAYRVCVNRGLVASFIGTVMADFPCQAGGAFAEIGKAVR
jgi:hypothetical protein